MGGAPNVALSSCDVLGDWYGDYWWMSFLLVLTTQEVAFWSFSMIFGTMTMLLSHQQMEWVLMKTPVEWLSVWIGVTVQR